jgi:hypothetical protein
MGAGRAAGFTNDTTDFGSVIGRSSGPLDSANRAAAKGAAAKGTQNAQTKSANHPNDFLILMRNLLSFDFSSLAREMRTAGGAV